MELNEITSIRLASAAVHVHRLVFVGFDVAAHDVGTSCLQYKFVVQCGRFFRAV